VFFFPPWPKICKKLFWGGFESQNGILLMWSAPKKLGIPLMFQWQQAIEFNFFKAFLF
jgi:hypothetical protein